MPLITAGTIYNGSTEIIKVYQGNDLIWSKVPPSPIDWPSNYYYPHFKSYAPDLHAESQIGIGLFRDSWQSGDTWYFTVASTDCGGDWVDVLLCGAEMKQTISYFNGLLHGNKTNAYCESQAASSGGNSWFDISTDYNITFKSFNSGFTSCTGMWYKRGEGHYCTGRLNFDTNALSAICPNIKILVDISDTKDIGQTNLPFSSLVEKCPNLKYISINSGETNTGQTLTLTGSTAWTQDSMKFTEWHCPETTFIVNDNSYWRGIIDWDIARERNVTFKDTGGNILSA